MKRTIVILEVMDDDENRDWWEALGLLAPERWNEHSPEQPRTSFVKILTERRLMPNGT